MRARGAVLPCSHQHSIHRDTEHMEGARHMIQVTERARETFKSKLDHMIESPGLSLRIGRTDSGLGVFPATGRAELAAPGRGEAGTGRGERGRGSNRECRSYQDRDNAQ